MRLQESLNESWRSLPPGASTFLKRASGLFIAWKLVYILVLLPSGEPDGRLVRTLAETTASTLNLMKGEGHYRVRHLHRGVSESRLESAPMSYIYRDGRRADVGIAAPCNGLELMVLAIGFILCFEGGWRRRASYIVASVAGVFAVNVIRCALLTVIKTDHPTWFVFAHKYLFNFTGYAFVFLVWMHYVRGLMPEMNILRSESAES